MLIMMFKSIVVITLLLSTSNCLVLNKLKKFYSAESEIAAMPIFATPTPKYLAGPPLPFPSWLSDFTGLKEWPGMDPPYIPLDFIKFDQIPSAPLHVQGDCPLVKPEHCSFDCINCIQPDDVFTCPVLSQTFDDGPTQYTRKLLAKLDFTNTKSTFFTLGVQNIKYPDIYRETMQKGHIMGSHTWSHKFLPSLTNEQIIAQIEWSIWSMNATGNHLPKWFRPPYGGVDNRVRAIVRQFGMQSVLWDMDTFDWKMAMGRTEGEILKDVKLFQAQRNGKGMILEHDALEKSVDASLKVFDIVGPNQMTVPQCVGGINYIKQF